MAWDFERMNELQLSLEEADGSLNGARTIISGPEHPFHARFNPGVGVGLGYEDLMVVELFDFVRGIAEGAQGPAGFAAAVAVADVQEAVARSFGSAGWEQVTYSDLSGGVGS